jgi:hypothetical protein
MQTRPTPTGSNKVAEVERLLVVKKWNAARITAYFVAKYHVSKKAFIAAYGLTLNTYGHV